MSSTDLKVKQLMEEGRALWSSCMDEAEKNMKEDPSIINKCDKIASTYDECIDQLIQPQAEAWLPKFEGYTSRKGQVFERVSELIMEGSCKESLEMVHNCYEKAEQDQDDEEEIIKCRETLAKLFDCMNVHFDYHAPLILAAKNILKGIPSSEE